MLAPEQLDHLREVLLAEQATLQDSLSSMREDYPVQSDLDQAQGVANHPAEDADLTFQHEQMESLIREQSVRLDRIEAALRRIEQGTYGVCERCGREIGFERLEAMPEATLCIDCQRIVEG